MNKKGVTIIELLIYIALFAIVSLLLGKQFKILINNYTAGKRMSRQQTESRDITGLMIREVRNTGVKVYFRSSGGAYIKDTASGTWVSTSDKSSFRHTESTEGNYGDQLTIYYARLNDDGDSAGVDSVTYYLDGTSLRRELKSTSPNTNSLVAENVYALQFEYGIYALNELLFDEDPIISTNWEVPTGTANVSWGSSKLTFTGAGSGYLKYKPSYKNVVKNRKYTIHLRIDASGGFPDALESLRFDFYDVSNSKLCGYENFMPSTGERWITVRDSVTGNAEMRLRFESSGAGVLTINGIEAICSADNTYTWSYNPTTAEKVNVRAIKIYVLTRTSGKAGTRANTPIQVANVSVPRSGEYTWRLYQELIEVPNNGKF